MEGDRRTTVKSSGVHALAVRSVSYLNHQAAPVGPAPALARTCPVRQLRLAATRTSDGPHGTQLHRFRFPPSGAGARHLPLRHSHGIPLRFCNRIGLALKSQRPAEGVSSQSSSKANGEPRVSTCPSQGSAFKSVPHVEQSPWQSSEHSGTSGTDKHSSSWRTPYRSIAPSGVTGTISASASAP